ncbi:MAG TPA: hypothetical protein VGT08_18730 [Terracidiphilus sp.]|nr:hypothetical protein [Terracidiphilus sp.]
MPKASETIKRIVEAPNWDQRIAQIRLIPQNHGTGEHPGIFAEVARLMYLPNLAPDFAYIHEAPFYEEKYFLETYSAASEATDGFSNVSEDNLTKAIQENPRTLLVFRTVLGLTKTEFAFSTVMAGELSGMPPLTPGKIDSMERDGTATKVDQAKVAAQTICQVMGGSLFGTPPAGLLSKQAKPDTARGWASVQAYASEGVPLAMLLHQRHYGGAFRQVLDATSTQRGDLIEDAVEALFKESRVPFIRTGSHNQAEIADRFEVQVKPAPDFVVFDQTGTLRAMLECKGTNDGGTARDKALRFQRLRQESIRLNGVPLIAVLGGAGWARINDALGPVVRDTEGRVFTRTTLHSMLDVSPFPALINTA